MGCAPTSRFFFVQFVYSRFSLALVAWASVHPRAALARGAARGKVSGAQLRKIDEPTARNLVEGYI